MVVMTRAGARSHGLMPHPSCEFVASVSGEDCVYDEMLLSFPVAANVAAFIKEMEPREINVLVGKGEDAAAIRQRIGARAA